MRMLTDKLSLTTCCSQVITKTLVHLGKLGWNTSERNLLHAVVSSGVEQYVHITLRADIG